METSCDFTIPPVSDRTALLAAAAEVLQLAEEPLGPHRFGPPLRTARGAAPGGRTAAGVEAALDELRRLGEEVARFSAQLAPSPLVPADLPAVDAAARRERAAAFERYRFHRLPIPITLIPRSGWAFTRLECRLRFCDEAAPAACPTVHDLFPAEEWVELMSLRQGLHLDLDLDTDLRFRPAAADGSGRLHAGAGLALGPLHYQWRRPAILSRGRGDVECFWRLEGECRVEREELALAVILKTPRERSAPLRISGVLRARHAARLLGELGVSRSEELGPGGRERVAAALREALAQPTAGRQVYEAGGVMRAGPLHNPLWDALSQVLSGEVTA